MSETLTEVLRAHRADGWVCTCGWPLNDSVGSVVDHIAAQVAPLMRCSAADPDGARCRLFSEHDGQHGDGLGTVWDRDYHAPATGSAGDTKNQENDV